MAEVVSLKGEPVVSPGTPRPEVAAELRALADMADAGELQGCVVAALFRDNCTSYRLLGKMNRATIGVLAMAQFQLLYDDMKESES